MRREGGSRTTADSLQSIITSQSAELELMRDWLSDWYEISQDPQMKPGAVKQMERLASRSGAEFEIEFMEMMIRHHSSAVREGEQCVRRAYHDELIELCQDIIETQTAAIQQMEEWLCEWYDRCGGGR